ncbi:MAG TPA: VacJ family lipoprotein [Methylobacter sp.]|jgi:phospholipid-binding lipoprotein MlaA
MVNSISKSVKFPPSLQILQQNSQRQLMNRHKTINTRLSLLTCIVTTTLALTGCAATTAKEVGESDPWQGWNKSTQSFNDSFDKHVLKPVAVGYLRLTNEAVDEGVTHFFNNINDIGVTINDILQLKLLQGGMDISRFIINTTAGVAGVFDWANKIDLPKHNEDFGQTLGFWGVPSGPYLVLPFLGASTPRDTVGLIGDALMDPLTYVSIFGGFAGSAATVGTSALDVTDYRAGVMSSEKVVDEATNGDRYDFIKNSYLQHREYLIYDGNPPSKDDPLDSDESGVGDSDNMGNKSKAKDKNGNGASTAPPNPKGLPTRAK